MIAVTFALPQESRNFIRALEQKRRCGPGPNWMGNLGGTAVLVSHTGVGAGRAAVSIDALLETNRPQLLINAGFAGALDPSLAVGDLIIGTSESGLVDKCRAAFPRAFKGAEHPRIHFGLLTTQPNVVESIDAKADLAKATGALGVDMESAIAQAACAHARVPFLAVRVVSDRADQAMPVPMEQWFDMDRQRPRPFALAGFLMRNPGRIAPFAKFVSGLEPCRRNLSAFLVALVPGETGIEKTGRES